jgi:hypothetical protein
MKQNEDHKLSRREFARRAALLSATASIVPAGMMLPAEAFPNNLASAQAADLPKLSHESSLLFAANDARASPCLPAQKWRRACPFPEALG